MQNENPPDDEFAIASVIREAADRLEKLIETYPPKSWNRAKGQLAWHHLVDAHSLLVTGRVTPPDMMWAWERIDELGIEEDTEPGKR